MSERTASQTFAARPNAGRTYRRHLFWTSVAAGVLVIAGCGTSSPSGEASPGVSLPSSAGTATEASPNVTARNYCTDAITDRAQPLRVENGHLIVAIHGECTGNPKDPVGVYRTASQQKSGAVAALPNGTEFAARCETTGQHVQTDAAGTYNGPAHTGSNEWLVGTVPSQPEDGEVMVPWSNTGFVQTTLGGFTLQQC